jgi:glutamate-1-semialdehyde 2,1-aminomutase
MIPAADAWAIPGFDMSSRRDVERKENAMSVVDAELVAYRDPRSVSARTHQRAVRVMPGGNTRTTVYRHPWPPYAARGQGAVIVDAEGQERIDFLNNYTSLIHGHADPDVAAAVVAQMALGSSFGMPTAHEVDLAALLVERVPSVEQVRFTNSGTEAVMVAIQAARAFTGRPLIAKFEGSYHGFYDFAAVGTAVSKNGSHDSRLTPVPQAHGTPDGVTENVVVLRYNDLTGLEHAIEEHKDRLAAVLIDLMPWRMGLIAADETFVRGLREMTAAHGILLIVDEIITLRVSPGGMQSRYAVQPDLTTMGKVIGGGFPVGAVGGRAEVMAVFDPSDGAPKVPHGGTFNANPITMVAGLATMRKLTPEAHDRLDALGDVLREGLAEAMARAGFAGHVTGAGSLFGIGFGEEPPSDFRGWLRKERELGGRTRIYEALVERGAVVAPHLVGCLSTAITRADIDRLVDDVGAVLRSLSNESDSGPAVS